MDSSTYLTFDEFLERAPISASTLRRLIKNHRIPFVQPGGRNSKVLIPADALEQTRSSPAVETPSIVVSSPKPIRLSGRRPKWTQQTNIRRKDKDAK